VTVVKEEPLWEPMSPFGSHPVALLSNTPSTPEFRYSVQQKIGTKTNNSFSLLVRPWKEEPNEPSDSLASDSATTRCGSNWLYAVRVFDHDLDILLGEQTMTQAQVI